MARNASFMNEPIILNQDQANGILDAIQNILGVFRRFEENLILLDPEFTRAEENLEDLMDLTYEGVDKPTVEYKDVQEDWIDTYYEAQRNIMFILDELETGNDHGIPNRIKKDVVREAYDSFMSLTKLAGYANLIKTNKIG